MLFRFITLFAIALISVSVLVVSLSRSVTSQEKTNTREKVIEKLFFEEGSPVSVELTFAGDSVKFGDKFTGSEDWLRHICISLENHYPKPIIFAELSFDFPQTQATGNIMAFPISFGRNPRARISSAESKRLEPEGSAEIRLSEDDYSHLKMFLERRHPIASLTQARLRIDIIHFEDGAIWSDGWMRPDPNIPNRLIPIKDQ